MIIFFISSIDTSFAKLSEQTDSKNVIKS